jgi:hypothetical protein
MSSLLWLGAGIGFSRIEGAGGNDGHSLRCWMIMMCVASLVTASKGRQTGAKSCKAGKLHNAHRRALPDWRYKAIAAPRDIDDEPVPIMSVTQRAA